MCMIFIAFQSYHIDIQIFTYFRYKLLETYFYIITKEYLPSVSRAKYEMIVD